MNTRTRFPFALALTAMTLGCERLPDVIDDLQAQAPTTFTQSASEGLTELDPHHLQIATWNMAWLNAEAERGHIPRTSADYRRLAEYVERLDADIIIMQEVEGVPAASRVIDTDEYALYFVDQTIDQRVGIAYRHGLSVEINEDYTALTLDGGLRAGVDATLTVGDHTLRILGVHMKSGCFDADYETSRGRDCRRFGAQVPELEAWIDARAEEEQPFVVLGDFNRRLGPEDEAWQELDDGSPINADLTLVTEGHRNPCWDYRYPEYIDHIVADRVAAEWIAMDSFDCQTYDLDDVRYDDVLSDHCPIYVTLEIPE